MRVLVTGASGFIGHHLVRDLKKQGHWVRGVDWTDISEKDWDFDGDEFVLADLTDYDVCHKAVERIDEVYALAAEQGGIGFVSKKDNQARIIYNNTIASINTLDVARSVGIKKYLYTSSACVYPLYNQKTKDATALKESDVYPADPDNSYGWEKLQTEHFCKWYCENYGMDIKVVRFHNIYGPEEEFKGLRAKAPGAISAKILESIKNKTKEIEVWGDGTQRRSYCFIDDCIKSIRLVMDKGKNIPYNIGRDDSVSIKEVAEILIKLSGEDIKINYVPDHYAKGVMGRNCDTTLFRETFGYEADTDMKTGLTKTFEWIKNQMSSKK